MAKRLLLRDVASDVRILKRQARVLTRAFERRKTIDASRPNHLARIENLEHFSDRPELAGRINALVACGDGFNKRLRAIERRGAVLRPLYILAIGTVAALFGTILGHIIVSWLT